MLEVKNLTKKFDDRLVLNDFSYSFDTAGIYLLRGKSGVGKTTLLRSLSGLDKEYEGEITPINSVSFSFQEHRLFPTLSALDNILEASYESYTEQDRERAVSLLSSLNLSPEEQAKLPDELSGGMKQRVSFARAILKDSDILLLDEPTKELDENLREKILETIKSESRRRLVIVVSHNEDDLNELSATRIAI